MNSRYIGALIQLMCVIILALQLRATSEKLKQCERCVQRGGDKE